jgi:hypothetical protein
LDNAKLAQTTNAHQLKDQASDKINANFHFVNQEASQGEIVGVNIANLVPLQINKAEIVYQQLLLQSLAQIGLVNNSTVNAPPIDATTAKLWLETELIKESVSNAQLVSNPDPTSEDAAESSAVVQTNNWIALDRSACPLAAHSTLGPK